MTSQPVTSIHFTELMLSLGKPSNPIFTFPFDGEAAIDSDGTVTHIDIQGWDITGKKIEREFIVPYGRQNLDTFDDRFTLVMAGRIEQRYADEIATALAEWRSSLREGREYEAAP